MTDNSKALEALDRIFNYCEEIDLHIPEEEQTGYSMNDDVAIIREALFENQKTGHWIGKDEKSAVCSYCNRNNTLYGDFCKWCGARMGGE